MPWAHSVLLFVFRLLLLLCIICSTLALNILKRTAMIRKTKVAILGSGIAGSIVANTLRRHGSELFEIKVFEVGRGPGGRTSTRTSRENDFQFDHGMQFLAPPYTTEFDSLLQEWEANGCTAKWDANIHSVSRTGDLQQINAYTESNRGLTVGFPAANSIVKHLLNGIEVKYNTRAMVTRCPSSSAKSGEGVAKWVLKSEGEVLGDFDWVVSTDRMAASSQKGDLQANDPGSHTAKILRSNGFFDLTDSVSSSPVLAMMVVFKSPVGGSAASNSNRNRTTGDIRHINAFQFPDSNVLSWAARDSSKPSRGRRGTTIAGNVKGLSAAGEGGKKEEEEEEKEAEECWVVHSTHELASSVIASIKDSDEVAEQACSIMLPEFISTIGSALHASSSPSNSLLPDVLFSKGHRWSAAFPSPSLSSAQLESLLGDKLVTLGTPFQTATGTEIGTATAAGRGFFDENNGFAACGDYLTAVDDTHLGPHYKVEKSVLSAQAVARALIKSATEK